MAPWILTPAARLAGLSLALAFLPAVAPAGPAEPEPAPGLTGGWCGVRAALARRGVRLDATLLADRSTSLAGGLRRGSALRSPLDLRLALDAGPLLGLEGGRAELGFRHHAGRDGTQALVGDVQGFDNVDAAAFSRLLVLWYEQALFDSRVRVKVGKVDANTEFAYTGHGAAFLHSAAGYSPAIAGFPSYPAPGASVNVALEPASWLHLGGGVYSHRAPGAATRSAFRIGEAALRWRLPSGAGRLAAGAWSHAASQLAEAHGAQPGPMHGAYAVLDQELWRTTEGRGVGLFAQLGVTPASAATFDRHLGLGLSWTGPLRRRAQDVVGLLVSGVRLRERSAAGTAGETAFECVYAARLTPWLGVTADLQFIAHPSGAPDRGALVASIRTELKL